MRDTEYDVVTALAETHTKIATALESSAYSMDVKFPENCHVIWQGKRHDGHLTIYLETRVECINTLFFALISNDIVWGGAIDLDPDTGSHGNTYSTANARRTALVDGAVTTVIKAVDTEYPKFVQQQRDSELVANHTVLQ